MMINNTKVLNKGCLICPHCKRHLDFKVMGTMRLKEEINGKFYYSAKCPIINRHYYVEAPKD